MSNLLALAFRSTLKTIHLKQILEKWDLLNLNRTWTSFRIVYFGKALWQTWHNATSALDNLAFGR
ncbi:uncharacterized protein Dvar_25210 [Desulfosarcina variabilis str. Montpellier]